MGSEFDGARAGLGGDAVLDGVLDQGLDAEDGDGVVTQFGRDVDDCGEAGAETGALNLEVGLDDGELFLKADHVLAGGEEVAEDFAEAEDEAAGIGGLTGNAAIESVEGVEEEVGMDLGLEGLEFGLEHEAFELARAGAIDLAADGFGVAVESFDVFGKKAAAGEVELDLIALEELNGGACVAAGMAGLSPVPLLGAEVFGDDAGSAVEDGGLVAFEVAEGLEDAVGILTEEDAAG